MSLFDQLAKKQRFTGFLSSSQMTFFNQNRVLLDQVPIFARFMKATKPFDVIRANIIIQAILNKKAIEEAYSAKKREDKKGSKSKKSLNAYMKGVLDELTFMELEDGKIYLPIFPISLNRIYSEDYEKLSKAPYEALLHNYEAIVVDPFDTYGADLYNSYFTKLILVEKNKSGSAYYDYDSDAIYFVNKQGRLDTKICLFDKYLVNPNHNHMLKRIAPVVEAYYKDDKKEVKRLLVENKLISSKLIYRIESDESRKYEIIY
ncbi:MAG: hypothetical protein J6328_07085 [Bacilli bacterium]|nr:hypothetical protein [Bacilli bacterium]